MNESINQSVNHVTGVDDTGVLYVDPSSGSGLQISSPDVPVAVVMTSARPSASVFDAPLTPITDNVTGVAYNVFNNIWDTNYILW